MDTALTIDEIKARFDGEWVLIENPLTDDNLEIQQGTVRFHSTDAHEVYKKAAELATPTDRDPLHRSDAQENGICPVITKFDPEVKSMIGDCNDD